jgi:hypothetical protein
MKNIARIFGIVIVGLVLWMGMGQTEAHAQTTSWTPGQYSGWLAFKSTRYTVTNEETAASKYFATTLTVFQSMGSMEITINQEGEGSFSIHLPMDIAYQFHSQGTGQGKSCALNRYSGLLDYMFSSPSVQVFDLNAGKFNGYFKSSKVITTIFQADAHGDLKNCEPDQPQSFISSFDPFLTRIMAGMMSKSLEMKILAHDETSISGTCLPVGWQVDDKTATQQLKNQVQQCDWRVFLTNSKTTP